MYTKHQNQVLLIKANAAAPTTADHRVIPFTVEVNMFIPSWQASGCSGLINPRWNSSETHFANPYVWTHSMLVLASLAASRLVGFMGFQSSFMLYIREDTDGAFCPYSGFPPSVVLHIFWKLTDTDQRHQMKKKGFTKVVTIHPDVNLNVYIKFHGTNINLLVAKSEEN